MKMLKRKDVLRLSNDSLGQEDFDKKIKDYVNSFKDENDYYCVVADAKNKKISMVVNDNVKNEFSLQSNIIDIISNNNENKYQYELNKEKETNEIWFDGKPIYEQILKFELTCDKNGVPVFDDNTEYSEIVKFSMMSAKDTKFGFMASEGLSYFVKDNKELGVLIFDGKLNFIVPDDPEKGVNEDNPLTILLRVYYTK